MWDNYQKTAAVSLFKFFMPQQTRVYFFLFIIKYAVIKGICMWL